MDTTTYSSGEEEEEDFIPTKTRKPYTITKLRERWTQDEHNRFLDALKLYGRAWQRIEEHIGSKTAVQIRSHAQKFFTKLEKEALVKGVPVGQALDIDIPPPRPKRKPNNPYPRKTGLGTSGSQLGARDGKCSSVSCLSTHKRVVNLDKEPSREGTPCSTLLSSANRNPRSPTMACRNSCTCRESVSVRKIVHDDGAKNTLNFEMADASQEKPFQSEKTNEADQPEYVGTLPSNDMQATQNYPRHVPVHVLNASLGMATQTVSLDMPCQETVLNQVEGINHGHHPKPYFSYAVAASANTPHADLSTSTLSPTYPLFDPFHSNQDNYQANLEASSAFSGLIVSSLLQNPAAYAAASFAASFWPCANKEDCAGSAQCPVPTTLGGGGAFPSPSSSLPPSMAAIAAVTVAAATAWWAAHGLLPFCSTPPPPPSSPLLNGFNRKPDVSTAVNPTTVSEIINLADKRENEPPMRNQQLQQLELEYSEALQAQQQSALKLPTLFLVSEQSEGAKRNAGASASDNNKKSTTATAVVDPNKTKSVKLVDRSSCGSNTPSSSEVETDALGKHALEKAEEAFKEKKPDEISHPACDSNNCSCGRSSSSTSDSWKEVSEEGRLAFQALFSREVLPQSFSPSNDMKNKWNQKNSLEEDQQKNKDEKVEDGLELDLNIRMWESCCPSHRKTIGTTEIGQGKLKARRTGFKPYKRCSAEAKESLTGSSLCNQHEEKGSKRIRLDGEGSTWCLR